MKRLGVTFFIFILLISFASAQFGNIENQIDDTRDNIERNITAAREFTDKDRWDFIGLQWKEFLLKNKFIAGVDAAFTKANVVFVVLFAHDWELSLEMLFVFMLWLFTLLAGPWIILWMFVLFPAFNFIWLGLTNSKRTTFLIYLGATLILAHAKLFDYLAAGAVKIVLYKPSAGWRLLIFAVEVVALFAYLKLNRFISKSLKAAREKREKEELKEKVEFTERSQKTMIETAKKVMSNS